MKYLLLLPLALFACSDWPTKDSQENEENPIEIQNTLNDPADNDSMEVDVDSNSDSQSDSSSNSDSSSEATIDNSSGWIIYEFKMIN